MSNHGYRNPWLVPLAAFVTCALLPGPAAGQVTVPPQPGDQISVSIDADVTFDSSSGLYFYSYELSSAATSDQDVWLFAVELDGTIAQVGSPEGWTAEELADRPILTWAATETGPLPPDYVDDGNTPPSPFSIEPGATLSGFTFQSPDPPANAVFYAQGDTPLPQVVTDVGDLPMEGAEVVSFTEDSQIGITIGPKALDETEIFLGGRRPAVDGFLGFLNLSNGETRKAPISVVIRFAVHGETVDTSTFSATLNQLDVTAAFVSNGAPNELMAIFEPGTSPLEIGRNVLITSIEGIVPGTTRTASDVDRVTIEVE